MRGSCEKTSGSKGGRGRAEEVGRLAAIGGYSCHRRQPLPYRAVPWLTPPDYRRARRRAVSRQGNARKSSRKAEEPRSSQAAATHIESWPRMSDPTTQSTLHPDGERDTVHPDAVPSSHSRPASCRLCSSHPGAGPSDVRAHRRGAARTSCVVLAQELGSGQAGHHFPTQALRCAVFVDASFRLAPR
jgi:hypothetical protein